MVCLVSLPARGHEEFKNIREICRSDLAGIFFNIFSEHDDISSRYNSLITEKAAMEKKLVEDEKEYARLREEIDRKEYNPALQDKRIASTAGMEHLKQMIHDYELRTTKYKSDSVILQRKKQVLENALKKVFQLKITLLDKSPKHGKYSIRMEYNHTCSKYYAICPLPKADVEALLGIIKLIKSDYSDQSLQPACERYASVIPPERSKPFDAEEKTEK